MTTNVYDADGSMTSQTMSDSTGGDVARTQTVSFNSFGQKAPQTDAVGKITSFTYDAYGHVVTETDADGGQTKYDVDAEGNVLKVWTLAFTGDPNQPSQAADTLLQSKQYDPVGRVKSESDAMGWTTTYDYTNNGLPLTVTRSNGTASFVLEQNGQFHLHPADRCGHTPRGGLRRGGRHAQALRQCNCGNHAELGVA